MTIIIIKDIEGEDFSMTCFTFKNILYKSDANLNYVIELWEMRT
jgi:hypothetical protein